VSFATNETCPYCGKGVFSVALHLAVCEKMAVDLAEEERAFVDVLTEGLAKLVASERDNGRGKRKR
jgi:hypothetical protein